MTNQKTTTVEVPIRGMDCSGCVKHVYDAIKKLDDVESVDVFLSSEKAVINLNPKKVDLGAISKAVDALAQANVGIAMGAKGTDVAIEAVHVALMRDDWTLVPEVLRIAQRTMKVVKQNIAFTAVYNLVGLSLAALGFLPPIFAAAAQSLPDLGILANSVRLLRQK